MIRLYRQQNFSTIGGFCGNGDLFTLPARTHVNNKHARLLLVGMRGRRRTGAAPQAGQGLL